jgi:hypothetical protein
VRLSLRDHGSKKYAFPLAEQPEVLMICFYSSQKDCGLVGQISGQKIAGGIARSSQMNAICSIAECIHQPGQILNERRTILYRAFSIVLPPQQLDDLFHDGTCVAEQHQALMVPGVPIRRT